MNVWPATVTVPLRAPPVFADTEYATVPLPVPLPPLVIVIQLSFAVAVQAHELPAETAIVPLPPDAASDCVEGSMA